MIIIFCYYYYLLLHIAFAVQSYSYILYVTTSRGLQTQPISTSATLPPASACIGTSSPESPRPPPGPTSKFRTTRPNLHPHLLNHHRRLTILTIPNQTASSSPPLHPSRPLSLPTHTHTSFMWGQLITSFDFKDHTFVCNTGVLGLHKFKRLGT